MRRYVLLLAALMLSGAFIPLIHAGEGELALSPSGSAQMHPSVWEGTVVWEDYRNDPNGFYTGPGSGNPDIYAYNVSTEEEIEICTVGSAQQNPDIWKNLVVWEDYRNGNADIYIFDMTDPGQRIGGTRLTFDPTSQVNPRIWGNYVVWVDYRNGLDGDIYAYDLSKDSDGDGIPNWKEPSYGPDDAKDAIFPICTNIYEQREVAIWGNIVVWKDYRNDTGNGDRNIYGYDMSEEKEFQITSERHNQFQPDIYGNTVVWVDMRDGTPTIYAKNLETGDEFRVAPDGRPQRYPSIFGNMLAWVEDTDAGKRALYTEIGSDPTQVSGDWEQTSPVISALGIAWADGRERKDVNGREITIWNIYFERDLRSNRAPVISSVDISVPDDAEPGNTAIISVKARIYDPEGDSFTVIATVCNESVVMYDDGMHGDGEADDGIYAGEANISSLPAEIYVLIRATDEYGASSEYRESIPMVSEEQAMMTLIGIGAIVLVLMAIIGGIYLIRKRGVPPVHLHGESADNTGAEESDIEDDSNTDMPEKD